jgi:hypothetical protein
LLSRCLESDYAQREDFQDEADPRRIEKRFTGFTGFRAAGENKVYGLQFKNIGIENQELRTANGLNYSKGIN